MVFNFDNNDLEVLKENIMFHDTNVLEESEMAKALQEAEDVLSGNSEMQDALQEADDALYGVSEMSLALQEAEDVLEMISEDDEESDDIFNESAWDDDVLEMIFENQDFDIDDDSINTMLEGYVLNEANIVKMDAKTIKRRLLRRCALIVAKEANDPLYHKYVKYSRAKKEMRQQIQAKYGSKAKAKLKAILASRKISKKKEK